MKLHFTVNFFQIVILLIVGAALVKEFDAETKAFDNTALAIIYGAVFLFTLATVFIKRKKE